MSGAWANCSPTSSLPLLGLNQADEGLRANDRSLILSRRGGPEFVSEGGSCAPSPHSGVLPQRLCLCMILFCRLCALCLPCGKAQCAQTAKNLLGRRRRPCSKASIRG